MTDLSTPNPIFSTLLVILISFHFSLLIKAQSDSVSFLFSSSFEPQHISFQGDATSSGDAIQLTKRDELGNPLPHSVGRAVYSQPVRLWDATTGNLADFTTVFYFSVNRSGSALRGDGLAFFMAPLDSTIPHNSTGGLLGLFSPSSKAQVVAVEFDSFANEWDPNPYSEFPHIGINVDSVKSEGTVGWGSDYLEGDGAIVKGRIRYDSGDKELLVMVSYPESQNENADCLTHVIDLRSVVPEWVRIGFSASTGDLVQAHDILFWSFKSSLSNTTLKGEINEVDVVSI